MILRTISSLTEKTPSTHKIEGLKAFSLDKWAGFWGASPPAKIKGIRKLLF